MSEAGILLASDTLWTEVCGKECWIGEVEDFEKRVRALSDAQIWQMRESARKHMIEFGRAQRSQDFASSRRIREDVESAQTSYLIRMSLLLVLLEDLLPIKDQICCFMIPSDCSAF